MNASLRLLFHLDWYCVLFSLPTEIGILRLFFMSSVYLINWWMMLIVYFVNLDCRKSLRKIFLDT